MDRPAAGGGPRRVRINGTQVVVKGVVAGQLTRGQLKASSGS